MIDQKEGGVPAHACSLNHSSRRWSGQAAARHAHLLAAARRVRLPDPRPYVMNRKLLRSREHGVEAKPARCRKRDCDVRRAAGRPHRARRARARELHADRPGDAVRGRSGRERLRRRSWEILSSTCAQPGSRSRDTSAPAIRSSPSAMRGIRSAMTRSSSRRFLCASRSGCTPVCRSGSGRSRALRSRTLSPSHRSMSWRRCRPLPRTKSSE